MVKIVSEHLDEITGEQVTIKKAWKRPRCY